MSPRPVMKAIEGMRCDGASMVLIGCLRPVMYGVRLHVPSCTQVAPGHEQLRLTLDLHCCEVHKTMGKFKLDDLLTDQIKEKLEDFARVARPIDFKPDFDSAFLQYVDVFGPEYKKFVAVLEGQLQGNREQAWGGPIARV